MALNEQKEPLTNLVDKLHLLFGIGNHPKKQAALPGMTRFKIRYFIITMILFFYLQPLLFSSRPETISFSQFEQYVDQGIAGELVIGPESIKGMLAGSPKRGFATVRVHDPDLVKELDDHKIKYSGRNENRF